MLLSVSILVSMLLSTAFCKITEIYPPPNSDGNSSSKDIYFILMMSFSGRPSRGPFYNGSGIIPAVQVALDLINNDSRILNGYTLHYAFSDSQVSRLSIAGNDNINMSLIDTIIRFMWQCDHTAALEAFFKQVLNGPPKIALIGSGCSVSTEPVADISHFYNITQVRLPILLGS